MWEETAVANGRWMRNGPAYRRFQSYETKVLRKADQVICISETLKNEAIRRGVSAEKISIVTNAVERKMLEQNKSSALYPTVTERLEKNPDACTVGYIGSLRAMEGVDLTARAVAQLVQKGVKVQFFVLTGESGQAELRQLCKELGIENFSTIVGPVPHDEVATFYSLIDVFVVSRPSSRVTKLVTPLKPFEAMAMGRTVVASKLAALEEIIQHEKTGLLYKPDENRMMWQKEHHRIVCSHRRFNPENVKKLVTMFAAMGAGKSNFKSGCGGKEHQRSLQQTEIWRLL